MLVQDKGLLYYPIQTVKLDRGEFIKNLKIPAKLVKGVFDAKKILSEIKPNVVFSKGGYVGLPVTIASYKLKIPVIVHESDLSLGLANKIASKFCDYTLTTFEKTASSVKNGKFVGAPIRDELFSISKNDALLYYGFNNDKPLLLITGGSQGAKYINELTLSCLDELLKTFNVLHLVGKNNLKGVNKQGYKELEFTDMKYAYNATDICISRAGSNTAFELMALKIPTLFIPLPKGASRGDQIENAKYFNEQGLCYYIMQENLNEKIFLEKINELFFNKEKIIKNLINKNITSGNKKIFEILSAY